MAMFTPIVIVDGQINGTVSPLDRGFAYGDGLFETMRFQAGRLPLWEQHKKRLLYGCRRLQIPLAEAVLSAHRDALGAVAAQRRIDSGVVKVVVTRGEGGRGYATPQVLEPTVVAGLYPGPGYPADYRREGVRVRICEQRLSSNTTLAGLKHLNRLENVLARREWSDSDTVEGLMLDRDDYVIEATASNVFMVDGKTLLTPALHRCGVAGIARQIIIEILAARAGLAVRETNLSVQAFERAEEVFLCNSVNGIWPVAALVDKHYARGAVTAELQRCFDLYLQECMACH